MSKHPRASFDSVLPQLQTGDIVLGSGTTLFSRIVRKVTRSTWSHSGIVIVSEDTGEHFLLESNTTTEVIDVEAGVPVDGVQLVLLEDRIRAYPGFMAVRHLNLERTPTMLRILRDFHREVRGRPFDRNPLQLLRSAVDDSRWLAENARDLTSLFCSELVAEAYQRLGLLPEDPPSNEYTPKDFSSESMTALPLPEGVLLGHELVLSLEH